MANEEQLQILKQGVEVWNAWRNENPDVEISLRGADLRQADLREVNFAGGDFWRTDLRVANLSGANLQHAYLDNVYLIRADLRNANLYKANLCNAHLDLAWLQNANLHSAILHRARLIGANFSQATLTGAWLYGTARDDWSIDGITCDFIYWDAGGKERIPKNRNFHRGEFEELYKQLPTFAYYFERGFTPLDTVIMDQIVQSINERRPEIELRLDSFHSRGKPHAVFTVPHKQYVERALREVTTSYETIYKGLEQKQEQRLTLEERVKHIEEQNQQLKEEIESIRKSSAIYIVENHTTIQQIQGSVKGNVVNQDLRGEKFIMGNEVNKTIGRDLFENVTTSHVTTGDSFHDNAQKFIQTTTPPASQQEILGVLSFIQEQLPRLSLPDDVKEEIEHEVKGAEIQAKKPEPDKKKLVDRLKNAVAALKGVGELGQEAVMLGKLIGKAIQWCGEQWIG